MSFKLDLKQKRGETRLTRDKHEGSMTIFEGRCLSEDGIYVSAETKELLMC